MKKGILAFALLTFAAASVHANGLPQLATSSATIRLISGANRQPIPDVPIVLIAYATYTDRTDLVPTKGQIESEFTQILVTGVDGSTWTPVVNGKDYQIALSTPGYGPTVRDQMMDPWGGFRFNTNWNWEREYWVYPLWSDQQVGTLQVRVSSVPAIGNVILGEVKFNQTRESAAYGIVKATSTATSVLEIFNVPWAMAGNLSVSITVPGENKSQEVVISSAFPIESTSLSVDLSSALPPQKYEGTVSTSPPSVAGIVTTTDVPHLPIAGAKVNLNKWIQCNDPCNHNFFNAETVTDANGRFQFFDVLPSTTGYNLSLRKLGFYSDWRNFDVSTAPAANKTAAGTYQFLFMLDRALYRLQGQVRYNGVLVPFGDVGVNGNGDRWHGADNYANEYGRWMRSDARVSLGGDGKFDINGLPDGNVNLNANFRSGGADFNSGLNGQRDWDGSGYRSGDDRRITISSEAVTGVGPCVNLGDCPEGTTFVLTELGAFVSTGPVDFNIVPALPNTAGKISGNINFITTYKVSADQTLFIDPQRPIVVTANEDCSKGSNCNNRKMGMAALYGTFTEQTTTYEIINISSGTTYYLDLYGLDWALATKFDTSVDLKSTDTYRMDFDVTRSGRLRGQVKLPDGKNYIPNKSGNGDDPAYHKVQIDVRGINVNIGAGMDVDELGAFEFQNLAPGLYTAIAKPEGKAVEWPRVQLDDVAVNVGRTTDVTLKLKSGLYVQPQIFGLPSVSTAAWGYIMLALPAGQQMNQAKITQLFFKDPAYASNYSTTTASWQTILMEPGLYDFYLLMGTKYSPGDSDNSPASFYQFANFIGQVKSVAVQKSDTNPNLGTKAQPISIGALGSVGQASLLGHVKGSKIFSDQDWERIFSNFESEIMGLIPAVMLYDNAGDLRGFSHAMPDETAIIGFWNGMLQKDKQMMIDAMAANPMRYLIPLLPPGKYTGVFANPNYPPVVKEITLASGDNTFEFDFDGQRVLAGALTGIVRSSDTGTALADVTVSIKHRMVDRVLKTGSDGKFSAANMPPGIYRVEASKAGYTTAGDKAALGVNGTLNLVFYLYPSTSSIAGYVYTQKFPSLMTKEGIQVVAYDETANTADPEGYLPKLLALTDTDGAYELPAVIPGHIYKLSAILPGKLIETLLITAEAGLTAAPDIYMKDSPPDILLKVKRNPENRNKVDITVKSPKELRSAPSGTYNPGQAYSAAEAVSLTFIPGPENTYLGQFALSRGERYYTIRVVAGEENNQLVKVIVYDQLSDARTDQFVQEAALAGGEVQMDQEKEEYSGLELDPGSLTISTGTASDFSNLVGGFFSALPSVRMVKTDRGTSESVGSALSGLLASEVYDIDLSSAQQNKSVTLTLKYDKEKVTDTGSLRIYQYNAANGQWEEVPGNYTVDPMSGVVSINVASIQEASKGSSASSPMRAYGRAKISPQGVFVPNAAQPTSQTGQFAVFQAKPPTGTPYLGEKYEIYNMPNPFDLKAKTVNLSSDRGTTLSSAYSVKGTLIKYHLPAGKTGHVKFLIYNVAGERVREIDDGTRAGGQVYYSEWDGKNDSGSDCASGVYFLLTQVDGNKLGAKTHKMALVK